MKFTDVCIEALSGVIPPERWSSEDVEEKLAAVYDRLRLPKGRLELMTGIKARRFWPEAMPASRASALAGEAVLANSTFKRDEIDLLAHAAVCRDQLEPATASSVHRLLGLGPRAQIFDVSNACLGFLNGLVLAAGLIQSGAIKRALICAGENGRPLVERTIEQLLDPRLTRKSIKPFFASLTIGAGAVAATLCHASLAPEGSPRLLGGVVETDTSHNELCVGDSSGSALEMQTNSEELLNAGLGVARRCWVRFKEETGWDESTPDRIVCHQVGKAHQLGLYDALGLDLEKDYSTFDELGNVGSVSLPISFAQARDNGAIAPGDKVALLGIGSGLSSMMLSVQC